MDCENVSSKIGENIATSACNSEDENYDPFAGDETSSKQANDFFGNQSPSSKANTSLF